ncbi:cystatin-B-like isoform X1 [Dendropsophus ebraccatus]|uniref:cystatin-B-like isoform X1 n=1 Tax=Dendropsophus ebraccatus TaxID=150705 RepID=UPI003831FE63
MYLLTPGQVTRRPQFPFLSWMSSGGRHLWSVTYPGSDQPGATPGVKPTVEEKHGKKYTTFVATEYKTQLVAGTNYFVKVHVGDEEYLHLRMYKTLPHDGEKLSLTAVQAGKTKQEEIVHFD